MLLKRHLWLALLPVLLLLTGTLWASPRQQIDNFDSFTLAIRADLENLADEVLGVAIRPPAWTGNIDRTTLTYVGDLWFDSEQLADLIFGLGERPTQPTAWIGLTSDRPIIIARNTRHDVELIADEVYGFGQRPDNWQGASQLFTCSRTLLNTLAVYEQFYNAFSLDVEEGEFGFCTVAESQVQEAVTFLEIDVVDTAALDELFLAVRGDIERLANELYGTNDRPVNWSGNADPESPLLAADNAADIDLLAEDQLGDERPPGYSGLASPNSTISFRRQRRDLELLADALFEGDITTDRPRGWQGREYPFRRCVDLTQNLTLALLANYPEFILPELDTEIDYCVELQSVANSFAENPPIEDDDFFNLTGGPFLAESNFAFSYFDLAALQYVGVMPQGVEFRAWYRNFGDSTMMFVSGEDFALYVDRRFTTLPQDVFDRLPSIEGVAPLTFCDASWCNGPGPTPTPTGGARGALVAGVTPPPQLDDEGGTGIEGKVEVTFENIRIDYLQDNLQTGTAQVTLQLCGEPQLISCEPVVSVFDSTTGAQKPVISQFNGLNVYEFVYGYSQNVIIESDTRFSRDIFVSDPTLPRN